MPMSQIAMGFLVFFAVGGVAWVLLYPFLSSGDAVAKRKDALSRPEEARRMAEDPRQSGKKSRDQIEQSLKEMEDRKRRSDRPPLHLRIQRAGLDWSTKKFYVISVAIGLSAAMLALFVSGEPIVALLLGFAGGLGLPFWILGFLKKRREKKFINAFPEAVDVIVRGIKSGLPLLDCLKMIALEASEPLRSEFKSIIERQAIGIPLGEACGTMYERIPLPEANFFGIVIMIQQKAGGNLSEALGNLSRVLRDRKKMRAKITAVSQEAKASAMIIGSLPVFVMGGVYLTTPDYIMILFTDTTGRFLLALGAFWMSCGIFVMKKMINFDF